MAFNSKFRWINDQLELERAALELSKKELLAVDTETAFWQMGGEYERLALLQIGVLVDEGMLGLPTSIADYHVRPQTFVYIFDCMDKGLDFSSIKAVLEGSALKIAHNASFDCRVMERHLGIKMNPVWCTMRAEKRINKKKGASMAALAERYFSIELDKAEQQFRWEHRPLSQVHLTYAAKDAVLALWFYLLQVERKMNGAYAHFKDIQEALPFEDLPEPIEDNSLRFLHTWLKDWIARGGPKEYPDREFWLLCYSPPYLIWDLEEQAQLLESRIATLEKDAARAPLMEVDGCGCGIPITPDYWVEVLRALYRRVVKGEVSGEEERLTAMSAQIKQEGRDYLVKAAEEDAFEREQIAFLADAAEKAAIAATVIPYKSKWPDYSATFLLATELNRLDLTRRYKRVRHTW